MYLITCVMNDGTRFFLTRECRASVNKSDAMLFHSPEGAEAGADVARTQWQAQYQWWHRDAASV